MLVAFILNAFISDVVDIDATNGAVGFHAFNCASNNSVDTHGRSIGDSPS